MQALSWLLSPAAVVTMLSAAMGAAFHDPFSARV
jgi:hypothetical protein